MEVEKHAHPHVGHAEAHHESFWRRYVFSQDHKVIGIQYGLTALVFLLTGFLLMLLMRWQMAFPGKPIPLIGGLFSDATAPGGQMLPEFFNQLGAMHGTIMVFMAIVPLVVGAFGNYVVPLQIGAPDMAFPKLNMVSYWCYLPGGILMVSSFFLPGGAARSGWTSYPPLSILESGQTMWLFSMVLLITSSLLGSVNFIVTIVQLRARGLTFMRLPFFVWCQLVTSFLLLLAFPPLEAAAVLQLMDRLADTSFFMPEGLVVSGELKSEYAGGGSPLLWQHLFWFLAHPEVYVLILPAMGMVGEIIANNTRKPLWGYRALVYSVCFVGFMSFIVWAHHMFLTGMGQVISAFFQTTTMIISIPSVIILTCFLLSLWGASMRFNTPMLFALAFIPMFGIGGLTGLPLGPRRVRHPSPRHPVRDRPLPLRGGARHHLRGVRRDLLLVPQGDRTEDERAAGQAPLLAVAAGDERHLLPDADPGPAGHVAADVRRRRDVRVHRRRHGVEQGDDDVGVHAGGGAAHLHLQLLLEHPPRREGGGQPVERHHAGVDRRAVAAGGARQLPEAAPGLPPGLRVQPAGAGE